MKFIALFASLIIASSSFAQTKCRDYKIDEKLELKVAACKGIAALDPYTKIDLNGCVSKSKFNICESLENGIVSKDLEVKGYLVPGTLYVCTMGISHRDEVYRVDCNGNY